MEEESNLRNGEEINLQNGSNILDAQHCCFLCLQIIDSFRTPPISLKCLCRCLQINIEELFCSNSDQAASSSASTSFPGSNKELEANLCESCEIILIKFSQTFLTLEKYQMEVQYWLEKVHQQIFEGLCKPERVENYSKMMEAGDHTDDDPVELRIMDDLRKIIATRSLEKKMTCVELELKLFRSKQQPTLKTEELLDSEDNDCLQISSLNSRFPPPPPCQVSDEEDPNPILVTDEEPPPSKLQVAPKFSKYHFNSKTKKYHCQGCEREFMDRSHAWKHYQSAHTRKQFKCNMPACDLAFSQQSILIKHQRTCSTTTKKRLERNTNPEYQFSCQTCGKRFIKLMYMEKHRKLVHLNLRKYSCDICDKKFKVSTHLTVHKDTVHFRKKYPCKICKKIYRSRTGRVLHEKECSKKIKIKVLIRNNKPESEPEAVSTSGSQANDDVGSLVEEIPRKPNQETHNNNKKDTGNNIKTLSSKASSFPSSSLSPETEDKSSQHSNQPPAASPPIIKSLMYSNHNPQTGKYTCNFHSCGKQFGTGSGVRFHYLYVHLKKSKPEPTKVQCEMCFRYFTSYSKMYNHQKVFHLNQRNYKCEKCGFLFKQKHHLKEHLARKKSCK